MARTERLEGLGDISFTKTGHVLARAIPYALMVVHPDSDSQTGHIDATLDLDIGTSLHLADGRVIDLLECGRPRHGVNVLAISELRTSA